MTKTQEKRDAAAEALPSIEVPINAVRVLEQHRRHFDEKKIKELAGSIAKAGVLQPLLMRQDPEDPALYILVAGERRLRAAKLAGRETVPARVGAWTEEEAAEIQAFENLHRADLTPVEEARAFKTLKDVGGHDVEALAERVDKSVAYVYRALALLELPAAILKEIEVWELTPAHGHQLMRCPPEDRLGVYKEWRDDWDSKDKGFTALSLREFVDQRQGQDLTKAIFPKDKPYAGQVACAGCAFNSGNQGQLFDGAEKGKCLNTSCFKTKTDAFRQDVAEKAAKAFPGVKSAGVVDRDYSGLPKTNGVVIQAKDADTKKLRALVEESPEKFSLVVAKESTWGEKKAPEAFLVCKDRALLEKAGVVKPEPKAPAAARQSQEDVFVDQAVDQAVWALAARSAGKVGDKRMLEKIVESFIDMTGQVDGAEVFEALGVPVPESRNDWEALSAKQLLAAAWLFSFDCGTGNLEEALKKAGVDVAKEKKRAKEAAKGEWALREAGKKAEKGHTS
jgi:ParB/RepB/Spo0J family partition protein